MCVLCIASHLSFLCLSFSMAFLCTPITSPYRMPFGTLRAGNDSVRIFLADFVVFFMISVHEGTTELFSVFLDCFTFHLVAFAVLFSSFSIALLNTPIASPTRMPFGTLHACRCSWSR